MPVEIRPVRLASDYATLEPLAAAHADGLRAAVRDGAIWDTPFTWVPRPEDMDAEIDRRLALQASGMMLPFTVLTPDGRIAGMTTYLNIDAATPRVEIGATWYAKSVQGTSLNPGAKRLLLGHAFETLDCLAVELRTHHLNQRSRRAIERLGARLDGVLRHHMRMPDGTLRDTCVYSITQIEWPAVRTLLDARLSAHAKDLP